MDEYLFEDNQIMAIIEVAHNGAEVQAQGMAKSATVNFSGALMEMLATTYTQILLAAIREAIQNACDAARRAGMSFSDGVLVTLPTPENPVLMVADKGAGMTSEFMDTTYLSFGSSTKAGDNGAAGGLGVGRWAAYGYIRECVISTCHARDMRERTYFQFQGEGAIPQVQLAATLDGGTVGTKVSFPVKASDVADACHIVAWLKEIMHLTMNDSFSIKNAELLPSGGILELESGTILELGEFDTELAGVRIFPMTDSSLVHVEKNNRAPGSLIVLTNQADGIGGLPFKVRPPEATKHSIFSEGMIIEIPMSLNVPFMPSREEIKYTDEVRRLLLRIASVANEAVVSRVTDLYGRKSLSSKKLLNNLLGAENQAWHYFSKATRHYGLPAHLALKAATGGVVWNGLLDIAVPYEVDQIEGVKFSATFSVGTSKDVKLSALKIGEARRLGSLVNKTRFGQPWLSYKFSADEPLTIIYDDLASGGTSRVRSFLAGRDSLKKSDRFIFIKTKKPSEAKKVADLLNQEFEGGLCLKPTSSLPEVIAPRKIVGARILKAEGMRVTYYDVTQTRQDTDWVDFCSLEPPEERIESVHYWLCKEGTKVHGFTATFGELVGTQGWGPLPAVLARGLRAKRLYLLTPSQKDKLLKEQEAAKANGLFDLLDSDLGESEEERDIFLRAQALKSWVPIEEGLATIVKTESIQLAIAGKNPFQVTSSNSLSQFCHALRGEPRLILKGTKFDSAIAPVLDVISGNLSILNPFELCSRHARLCEGLVRLGGWLDAKREDFSEHQALVSGLEKLSTSGHLSYEKIWLDLCEAFPLLSVINPRRLSYEDQGTEALCVALATLHR